MALRPSARAAPRSVDGIVLVAIAACVGALAPLAPIAIGAAVGVVLVLALFVGRGSWRRQLATVLAALAFAAAALRAGRTVEGFRRAHLALGAPNGTLALAPAPWPARCSFFGEVTRSPALLAGGLRVEVAIASGDCAPERGGAGASPVGAVASLVVPEAEIGAPARGDQVRVVAQLAKVHVLRNPGASASSWGSWAMPARRGALLSGSALDLVVLRAGRGPGALVDRARARVRERIRATFTPRTEAMARALVLGEDDVADEDRRAFQASGLSHLLAVSGMHLVVVVSGVVAALRELLARLPGVARRVDPGRVASAAGVPLAFVYADAAGGSGSARRAAFMAATALLARALARRPEVWRALGLSALAMLAVDPLAPCDLSFVLSVAATVGLLVVGRPLDGALAARAPRVPSWVRSALAATAGASVACAPVLATMTPDLPLVSLLANVVAVPVGEVVALPLCLLHAALAVAPGGLAVSRGCALAAGGALEVVRVVARASAAASASVPLPAPTLAELVACSAAVAVAAIGAVRARTAAVAGVLAALALEIAAHVSGAPSGLLRVTFLDVAQGDAALVDLPDGSALLVDGGGLVGSPLDVGERVLAPVLRARRRGSLRAVVLSHPHPDHFLGLERGVARASVGELWDTGQGEVEGAGGAYAALLATLRGRGVRVRRPAELCGEHRLGGATVEVLAPCPGPDPGRGPNDNSFVLRVGLGARHVLLVGDAERAEEAELLARDPARLRADVLKVGHHGSRTSSSPVFLAAVAPSHAVISSGVRNRFGHPHGPTLLSLARTSARVLRTDLDGAITVTTDGASLEVATAEDGP